MAAISEDFLVMGVGTGVGTGTGALGVGTTGTGVLRVATGVLEVVGNRWWELTVVGGVGNRGRDGGGQEQVLNTFGDPLESQRSMSV